MNQCKKSLIENVSYNKNINVRSSSFFWLAKELYIQNQKNDFQSLKNKIYNRNINFLSELNERYLVDDLTFLELLNFAHITIDLMEANFSDGILNLIIEKR